MKQTAIVVAPGRGTYNKADLGYLARHHAERTDLIDAFDALRWSQGQESVATLDRAPSFSTAKHTRGDNASPLIFSCAYLDFIAISRDKFDIIGITGNSMGWYIALACAGAIAPLDAFTLVNTMGALMQEELIGGQLVYPFVDDDWRSIEGRREEILGRMAEIDARPNHDLMLSIDFGGMLVLAGNDQGLRAFTDEMPRVDERFPLRLANHAAFHTHLQESVAAQGRAQLPEDLFQQPQLPLIDGRGAIWYPKATDITALWSYTLGHQVVAPYDFTKAIRVAAREFMPDLFIVLGPGNTLGSAIIQSLILSAWRGWCGKADFQRAQAAKHRLIAMGCDDQRPLA